MDKKNVDRRVLLAGLGGAVAGSLIARNATAGQLNPSAGPGPTGIALADLSDKVARTAQGFSEARTPLEAVSGDATCVRRIVQSGSYYATQHMFGPPNMDLICIDAPNVVLDLGDFTLFGPPGSPGGANSEAAIRCTADNVCVYEGNIHNYARGCDFGSASRALLWDITVIQATAVAVLLGSSSQCYDLEIHASSVGVDVTGDGSICEEVALWQCGTGIIIHGTRNLMLSNCATQCGVPFSFGNGNTYGPIVVAMGTGDLSAVPGGNVPGNNLVF